MESRLFHASRNVLFVFLTIRGVRNPVLMEAIVVSGVSNVSAPYYRR